MLCIFGHPEILLKFQYSQNFLNSIFIEYIEHLTKERCKMPKIIQKSKINNTNNTNRIKKETKKGSEISNLILENTVSLQRNLVETTEELKNLNIKLTRILDIFDKASRTFQDSLEKGTETGVVELEKKIDALIEQNRIIAKGLLLLGQSTRSATNEVKSGFKAQQSFNGEEDSEENSEEDKSDYSF